MKKILIKNIKELTGINTDTKNTFWSGQQMNSLKSIKDAYLVIEDEKISSFGKMVDLDQTKMFDQIINAQEKLVLLAWCDSHTHLVFVKTREIEYIDKIKGLSYAEIARRGGGILNSALSMQSISEEQLYNDALLRIEEITKWRTGAVEIKSGYGLSTSSELKMLRVIKRLNENSKLTIKSTFLGAHAIPKKYINNKMEILN